MDFAETLVPYEWNIDWIPEKLDRMLETINIDEIPESIEWGKIKIEWNIK